MVVDREYRGAADALADPRIRLPSPLEEVDDEFLAGRGVRLWLKRDDLIDTDIPGNKWRKLRYNLAGARAAGHDVLLTFGGAYSHHIAATAAAGHRYGFTTIGVIRGERHLPLNPMLARAAEQGMRLTYLDRATYRRKTDPDVIDRLRAMYGRFQLIPEGGSNTAGVRGCRELGAELVSQIRPDLVCCPVGSGGTLAGLAAGVDGVPTLGVCVLRGDGFMDEVVEDLQVKAFGGRSGDWQIAYGHHHGGYAKRSGELDDFIDDFAVRHRLVLEPVYVAKMLHAVHRLVADGRVRAKRIVAVVTGPAVQFSPRSSRSNRRVAR